MNIGRTLFWFKDGKNLFLDITHYYFAYGNFLNRLMNEVYSGKKIKFININFYNEHTYEIAPALTKNSAYFFGGHLQFYDIIDYDFFNNQSEIWQKEYIWNRACEDIKKAAIQIKNEDLLAAAEYAYKKGIELNLNPDYALLKKNLMIHGKEITASVWLNFGEKSMNSSLILEREGKVFLKKDIESASNGNSFFLEVYKKIEIEGDTIVVKGLKDSWALPLKVKIDKDIIP